MSWDVWRINLKWEVSESEKDGDLRRIFGSLGIFAGLGPSFLLCVVGELNLTEQSPLVVPFKNKLTLNVMGYGIWGLINGKVWSLGI